MLSANHKIAHPGRVLAMGLAALALLLLAGYALGGCGGLTGVTPSSQGQTPIPQAKSPTPPPLPTEQPTAPRPLPSPEQTAPIIPTPAPTLKPTFPPPPPTFTPYPTFTRLPTPTPAPSILLTDPVPQPNLNEQGGGVAWFAQTGHTIRGAFMDHWNKNGEAAQFGYPLTEEYVEVTSTHPDNSQLRYQAIQYFEHAIFTRQTEAPLSSENGNTIQPQTPTLVQTQMKVQAQLGISGTQMLEQNGYATGRYPLFGYASDFSWISGRMEFFGGITCLRPDCGCAYLSYDRGNTLVQFGDRTWWSYTGRQVDPVVGKHLVVFGRLAGANERPEVSCPAGRLPTLYIVRHAQTNLTQ